MICTVGHIPNHIGKLTALTVLRLCNNQLAGGIPDSIGDMISLEQLNLSNNHLKGKMNKYISEHVGSFIVLYVLYILNEYTLQDIFLTPWDA